MNTRTFALLQILLAAIAALSLVLTAPGCATTWTAQSFREHPDGIGPEMSCQRTLVFALGKSGIDSATPHVENQRTPGQPLLMTSGSETSGIHADEAIVTAVLDSVLQFIVSQLPQPAPLPVDALR